GGGRGMARASDPVTMPLFVRAGALLPLGPVRQYPGEHVDEPLTVHVFPGADAARRVYDDDGVSVAYQQGDWMGIDMRWDDRARRLDVRLASASRFRPPTRPIVVRVVGTEATRELRFSGTPASISFA